jgi:hypothetical protein
MKSKRGLCTHVLLWSLVLSLAAPPGGIMAQSSDSGGQMIFRQEELDQMLAPIALYPDELLVQVLMAATYPLEVVRATRWVQANPNLSGDQLAAELEQQDWDPSVKSLANFPSVLQMMNDRLEWTQKLGDAFLAQKDQVMDTVQELRRRAQAQGSLATTSEQRVVEDPQSQTIVIEPAVPEVVYVPVYDPMIVYGPWWWPAYRPYYYHPRGRVIAGRVIGFGIGVAVGVAWGYAWGGFNWHHHDVVINVTRNVYINNRIDRNRYVSHVTTGSGGHGEWRHDPVHRGGVAYRSPSVAHQFGRGPLPGADARRDLRGFDRGGAGRVVPQRPDRPAVQPRGATGLGLTKAEPPRQPAGPVQQPRVAAGPGVTKAEPPKQPAGTVQQPRVAAGPGVTKAEPPKQPAGTVQQPRVTAGPGVTKVEPPKQPAGTVQQPRVAAGPGVTKVEPPRQPAGTVQQPRVATSPARQGVQGLPSPTAFGGVGPGSQTRQSSNRGHESLSSGRTGGSAPGDKRISPGSGGSGGTTQRGGGPRK